mmetsp:Transcript_22483/g.19789  ORF Transcript_22483/g.19789 Transcript_22483/m.19789 type:complete len:572 (+) Transcript_22483:255-1970(+)
MQIMEESEQISQPQIPSSLDKIGAPANITLVKSYSEDAIDIHAGRTSDDGSSPSIHNNNKRNINYLMVDPNKKSIHQMSHSENEIDTDYELAELTEDEEDDYDNKRIYTSSKGIKHELPKKRTKMVHRANSDLNTLIHKSPTQSRYGRRKKKKKLQNLDGLSRDDLKYELLKEKKKRRGDRDKFKRESTALRNKFTNIADDYEDQLKNNETEVTQEYEIKLIQAEMQRQQLEQEVQRLKQLLLTTNTQHSIHSATTDDTATNGPPNDILSPASTIASITPRPGPITITSPSNHIYNQHGYNNHNQQTNPNNIGGMMTPLSTTGILPPSQPIVTTNGSSTSNNTLNTGTGTGTGTGNATPNFSVISSTQTGTPIAAPMMVTPFSFTQMPTPLEKKELSDEGVNGSNNNSTDDREMMGMIGQTNNNSMEYKLKMQMSPSLKHPAHQIVASFADITQLTGFDEANQEEPDTGIEGSDEDMDTGIIFNGYHKNDINANSNKRRQNNNNYHQQIDDSGTVNSYNSDSSSDEEDQETPSPTPPPKRTKRKKKKRIKEEKSFWDILVKCITPSVCEAE